MIRKPKKKPQTSQNSRFNHSLQLLSKPEPNSVFSTFNNRGIFDSGFYAPPPFDFAGSRHPMDDMSTNHKLEQIPTNFENFKELLKQEDVCKKIDPSQVKSIKPKEDNIPFSLSFTTSKQLPAIISNNSDESMRGREDSGSNNNKYDEEVQALLSKI